MTIPSVQEKKGYTRHLFAAKHLLKYFGRKLIMQADAEEQERYRAHRRSEGAAGATIKNEISLLSCMYHMALKRKMISYESMPGEFLTNVQINPRPVISKDDFQKLLDSADDDFMDVLISPLFLFKNVSDVHIIVTAKG